MAIGHPITKELIARVLQKIDKTSHPNGCWIWKGKRDKDGYGMYHIPNRRGGFGRAHRLMYEIFIHPILSNTILCCHSCDNRACVNPHHLWLGTIRDNNADRMAKGRHITIARGKPRPHRQGAKHWNARLSLNDVLMIRASDVASKELAKIYNVSITTINDIRSGRRWKHL